MLFIDWKISKHVSDLIFLDNNFIRNVFFHILISNVHNSVIVINSIETRFSRIVLEVMFNKLVAHVLAGVKSRAKIKHCCSFIKHYIKYRPAGLKCRSQVTGQVTGYRLQATGHRSGYRPQVRSKKKKKTIGHWTKLFCTDVLLYKNKISQGTLMIFLSFKQY